MKEILLYFSIKYNGDWEKIYTALETKETFEKDSIKEYAREYKGKYLTILDDEYPQSLKNIVRPPFVIFYKGNIKNINSEEIIWPFASMIDERINTTLTELSENNILPIVGYTDKIERNLFENSKGNKLIIVKDSGIDSTLIFSEEDEAQVLKDGSLILSEYPGVVIPTLKTWRESNKLKIALSNGMLLINSLKNRELFTMIAETIEEGKEIFCLKNKKSDINNHNNVLIEKGAFGISEIKHIKKWQRT